MILYHFTAIHTEPGCTKEGIKYGAIPQMDKSGQVSLIDGYQWLTESGNFIQSWCEGGTLPYDRTACRLTIKIPKLRECNLLKWIDNCADNSMADVLNSHGDPHHWWLYHGRIPPQWIIGIRWKHGKKP